MSEDVYDPTEQWESRSIQVAAMVCPVCHRPWRYVLASDEQRPETCDRCGMLNPFAFECTDYHGEAWRYRMHCQRCNVAIRISIPALHVRRPDRAPAEAPRRTGDTSIDWPMWIIDESDRERRAQIKAAEEFERQQGLTLMRALAHHGCRHGHASEPPRVYFLGKPNGEWFGEAQREEVLFRIGEPT